MAPGGLVVPDSSVWIDYLNQRSTARTSWLDHLLAEKVAQVCLIDLILVEILRGYHSESDAEAIARMLLVLPFLEASTPIDHLQASSLYRRAREAGFTVRGTVDLMIATICVRNGATLLHNDSDFDHLARVSELKVWQPAD